LNTKYLGVHTNAFFQTRKKCTTDFQVIAKSPTNRSPKKGGILLKFNKNGERGLQCGLR